MSKLMPVNGTATVLRVTSAEMAMVIGQHVSHLDSPGVQVVHNQQEKSPCCQAIAQAIDQSADDMDNGSWELDIHQVQGSCSSNQQYLQASHSVNNTASCDSMMRMVSGRSSLC